MSMFIDRLNFSGPESLAFPNYFACVGSKAAFGLNSILFENIYNTQLVHVLQIQVKYKRDPEESRMTCLNLYPMTAVCTHFKQV